MAASKRNDADRLHLHIENCGELGPVFEATPARVRAALARRPSLKGRVRVTYGLDGDVLERRLASADAVFCWDLPDRPTLAGRAPRLRMIHVHGAGVSHLAPLDWLPRGVTLTNSRGVHGQRATEYAFMALLALNNRLPEMLDNQRKRRWVQLFSDSLEGKTLLIVGVGNLGGGVAEWAKRAGMTVIGTRRSGKARRHVDEMHEPGALRKLLPRADFVLVSAPFTGETRHLVGRREIGLLRDGAGLVNFARAQLVDYEALRERLRRGELAAVLDVFDPEPLPADSPLWDTPNLIITTHSSSDDSARYTPKTLDLVMENLERLLAGKALKNRVRPGLGY